MQKRAALFGPRPTTVESPLLATCCGSHELMNCLNVIQGDMSIIGPRPERPQFVEQLAEQIPFYRARHAVKPGLTGWAQVRYRYGASVEDARIKLEYDLYYIKHQGVLLNIRICLRTIGVILGLKGR
jgi:lipopolysaccharide/colanic/teichoic acid biosynthesis glycosyltransferase